MCFTEPTAVTVVGLRYFNVFGPRQDPNGAYAAVIPTWFGNLLRDEPVRINGDGATTRDFTYIENVVQANMLAATTTDESALNQVYNVAFGECVSLNELFDLIRQRVGSFRPQALAAGPVHREFRAGDVRHSLADVSKARTLLSYAPAFSVREGLDRASAWYRQNLHSNEGSL